MNILDIKALLKKIFGYNEKMNDVHVFWRAEKNFYGNNQWKKIYVLNDEDEKWENKRK